MVSQHGEHRFGGDWTTKKLKILEDYLHAYTTALKEQPFRKAYIDAFAGSGSRTAKKGREGTLAFPDLAGADSQGLLDGSARIALSTVPRFDKYIFIERSAKRCASLEALRAEHPLLADDITVLQAEANSALLDLCSRNWRSRRAVVFMDPYGMQAEWQTIEAIARTKAIDLWILFPLGMGVNRLLRKDGDLPKAWRERLTLLLGTDDWYEEFYSVIRGKNLLGDETQQVIKASTDTIGRYFNRRLSSVFAGVSERPAVLRNSTNSPLYLLCFAVGNPRAKSVALGIANHLLKGVT